MRKSQLDVALSYLAEHLTDPRLRVTDLARVACLSSFHFSREFRRLTGRSPHHYLVALRIERAKQVLSQGSRAVNDIAQECGYTTHSHFTTQFGRMVGCSPAAYRELCRRQRAEKSSTQQDRLRVSDAQAVESCMP